MGLKESIDKVNEAVEQSKKLTTKDRKKLKSSTFCGPNKSFPIPDCKHAAIAKTYLGRSKFPAATKKKIAACINRKAKALKCNVSKKAKANLLEFSFVERSLADSEIFKTTRELVDQSIENEGMELDFSDFPEGNSV